MAKFNSSNKGSNLTVNISGHKAYKMSEKDLLVSRVFTTFFNEDKYYGDTTDSLIAEASKMIEKDAKFVANLAVYARKELHLRSVTHALAALMANKNASKPYIGRVVDGVVERADDILEILACYLEMFGKPVPNGLKKALAAAMNKFDEFQFSKYNGGSRQVKFKDVLALTHAKPKDDKQAELFKKILDGTLAQAERWETVVSEQGNTAESWEKLIEENKIGYMAMLKNFRNIVKANPANIEKVYKKLSDKDEVLKSKQLPFRFFSAYKQLALVPDVSSKQLSVLEDALEHSVENMSKISGKTVIAVDVSGSMGSLIAAKSSVRCYEIASLFAAMANKLCDDVVLLSFDTELYKLAVSKRSSVLDAAMKIKFEGGGTDVAVSLRYLLEKKIAADRLIIFSDYEANCQWEHTCQSVADAYRREINPNFWVHAIDLQGYGTQQFFGARTNLVAGWSEKVLEFVELAERGFENQTARVENYLTW